MSKQEFHSLEDILYTNGAEMSRKGLDHDLHGHFSKLLPSRTRP